MRQVLKYFYHKLIDNQNCWYPFLSVYYLTYQCDFRCPYCSNGFNKPYYQLSPDIIPGSSVIEVLARIRQHCDYLVITGGEPLNHPDFSYVIEKVNVFKFKNVALNTNGYNVRQYIPQIAKSVHTLIFSVDTLNYEKADLWYGQGRGTFKRILSNIEFAEKYPNSRYKIIISNVVTPQNIPDLYEVYNFTKEHGFVFAACPELMGVKPSIELKESVAYRNFYDFLIAEKKKGGIINGSVLYLQHMRDFRKFSCRPFTMLVVDPKGHVYYPCLEIGHLAGNILECNDFNILRQKGFKNFGPQPKCDAQCHSACALGFSLILEYPSSIFYELFRMIKNRINDLLKRLSKFRIRD